MLICGADDSVGVSDEGFESIGESLIGEIHGRRPTANIRKPAQLMTLYSM